jgi:hypothetical protein
MTSQLGLLHSGSFRRFGHIMAILRNGSDSGCVYQHVGALEIFASSIERDGEPMKQDSSGLETRKVDKLKGRE